MTDDEKHDHAELRLRQHVQDDETLRLLDEGWEPSAIAEHLGMRERRARVFSYRVVEPVDWTAERAILRAYLSGSDRRALVDLLSGITYTPTLYEPYPGDGLQLGTWEQVLGGLRGGYLTHDEFDEIRRRADPPPAQETP